MDLIIEPHFRKQLKQQHSYWQHMELPPYPGNNQQQATLHLFLKNPISIKFACIDWATAATQRVITEVQRLIYHNEQIMSK